MISKISVEEYQKITSDAQAAKEILEDERFQFLRDYLDSGIKYAETSVLNNTIRDVQEVVKITDSITKIFSTPKKVQVDELSGQYKWLTKFYDDLRYYVQIKQDLEKDIAEKKVKIDDKPTV